MITSGNIGGMARKKQVIMINGGTNINISNTWLTSNGWDVDICAPYRDWETDRKSVV